MILKEEQIQIILGKLRFWSHTPTVQGPHFRLDEVAIDGWYDGVAMRRTSEPRPVHWGDYKTPGYLASRTITLTGTAVASNRFELQQLRNALTGELIDGGYKSMGVFTTTTDRLYIEVGLESKVQWSRQTDTFATFKMDLIAPDPRIYGPTQTWTIPGVGFNGGMKYPTTYPLYYGVDDPFEIQNLHNDGNSDAWPVITVAGTIPDGFKITDKRGNWVTYTGPVTPPNPVTLNFEEGWARQRNRDRTTQLVSRDWFPVRPEEYVRPALHYVGSGQGWMEIKLRDTWI